MQSNRHIIRSRFCSIRLKKKKKIKLKNQKAFCLWCWKFGANFLWNVYARCRKVPDSLRLNAAPLQSAGVFKLQSRTWNCCRDFRVLPGKPFTVHHLWDKTEETEEVQMRRYHGVWGETAAILSPFQQRAPHLPTNVSVPRVGVKTTAFQNKCGWIPLRKLRIHIYAKWLIQLDSVPDGYNHIEWLLICQGHNWNSSLWN